MEKKLSDLKFIDLLALLVLAACFAFFFWISVSRTTAINENRHIGEVKTCFIGIVTLILGFYYGSSKSSNAKDEQIKNLQSANNGSPGPTNAETFDKATKLAELKAALNKLDPEKEKEKAEKILAEITELEKETVTSTQN